MNSPSGCPRLEKQTCRKGARAAFTECRNQKFATSWLDQPADDFAPPVLALVRFELLSSRISMMRRSIITSRVLAAMSRQGGMKFGSKTKCPDPSRPMRAMGSVTMLSATSVSSSRRMFFRPSRTGFSSRPVFSS